MKKCRRVRATFPELLGFLCGLVFALLVGDTAAGLASGLAGSLALAAATVLSALTQVTSLKSLNSFHNASLHSLSIEFFGRKFCGSRYRTT